MITRTPLGPGGPFTEARLPDGTVVRDGKEYIARLLVAQGAVDDPRKSPQSNSAQATATEIYRRYPAITHDEHAMIAELLWLFNYDGGCEFDGIGSALNILEWHWRTR